MAYDLPDDERVSRIVQSPDGMDYLVTMDGFYWNALDWINDNTDWTTTDLALLGWNVARQMENDGTMQNPGNFPAEFNYCFQTAICYRINIFANQSKGLVNDNVNM